MFSSSLNPCVICITSCNYKKRPHLQRYVLLSILHCLTPHRYRCLMLQMQEICTLLLLLFVLVFLVVVLPLNICLLYQSS